MNFSITSAFKEAFEGTKKNFLFFLLLGVVYLILNVISNGFSSMTDESLAAALASLVVPLLISIVFIYFEAGVVKGFLNAADGQKVDFKVLISKFGLVAKKFVVGLLYGLINFLVLLPAIIIGIITIAGSFIGGSALSASESLNAASLSALIGLPLVVFALVFIALTYVSIRFGYAGYYVVDKDSEIMESFSKSSALTKGVKFKLFGFGILTSLLSLSGFILLGVGAFFTVPMSMLAHYQVYRQLTKQLELE